MRPLPPAPRLDPRRYASLRREMQALVGTYLPDWPLDVESRDDPGAAMVNVWAHLAEILLTRLGGAPRRNLLAFLSSLGAQIVPARSARAPLRFVSAPGSPEAILVPRGTHATASGRDGPIHYESVRDLSVVPGGLVALVGVDRTTDRICVPPAGFLEGDPAALRPTTYVAAALAAADTRRVSLEHVVGLAKGHHLRFVDLSASPAIEQQIVVKDVKGTDVLLVDALHFEVGRGAPVEKVVTFAPFDGIDVQQHVLYIRHDELLKLERPATVVVSARAPRGAAGLTVEWEQPGPEGGPEEWVGLGSQLLGPATLETKGPVAKRKVNGVEGHWLRARLAGPLPPTSSPADVPLLADVRLRSVTGGAGQIDPDRAFSNTTPIDLTLGREPGVPVLGEVPRLFDALYVASDEAFSKLGALIDLSFDLAVANAPPIVEVLGDRFRAFLPDSAGEMTQVTASLHDETRTSTGLGVHLVPGSGGAGLRGRVVALARAADGSVQVQRRHALAAPSQPIAPPPSDSAVILGDPALVGEGDVLLTLSDGRLYLSREADPASWHDVPTMSTSRTTPFVLPRARPDEDLVFVVANSGVQVKAAGDLLRTEVPWAHALSSNEKVEPIRVFAWGAAGGAYLLATRLVSDGKRLALYHSTTPTGPYDLVREFDETIGSDVVAVGYSELWPDGTYRRWVVLFRSADGRLRRWSEGEPAGETLSPPGSPALSSAPSGPFTTNDAASSRVGVLARDAFGRLLRFELSVARRGALPSPQGRHIEVAHSVIGSPTRIARAGSRPDAVVDVASSDPVLELSAGGPDYALGQPVLLLTPFKDWAVTAITQTTITLDPQDIATDGTANHPYIVLRDAGGALVAHGKAELDPWTHKPTGKWTPACPFNPQDATRYEVCDAQETSVSTPALRLAVVPGEFASEEYVGRDFIVAGTSVRIERLLTGKAIVVLGGSLPNALPLGSAFEIRSARLLLDQIGPGSLPSDPQLSWEYWNGRGWTGLAAALAGGERGGVSDGTYALRTDGHVKFRVPDNLVETDVAGQKGRWIRARLVGGTYVTESIRLVAVGPETRTVRDLTGIGAPRVRKLTIRYDYGDTGIPPQQVLTFNNLQFRDQTNAATRSDADFAPFEPLEAPGRALFVAFAERLAKPASLLVDVTEHERGGGAVEWSVLQHGAWMRVPADDGTGDLTRPGTVEISVPAPLERETRFGRARGDGWESILGCWLRADLVAVAPASAAPAISAPLPWPCAADAPAAAPGDRADRDRSPEIRGVFPNCVWVDQVRTIEDEPVGSTNGEPGQAMRLRYRPVQDAPASSSLDLRVLELLSAEEREQVERDLGADAVAVRAGPRGETQTWVRWSRVPDFAESGSRSRHFVLDPDAGEVRFGDDRAGRIPPAGIDNVRAFRYRVGGGVAGNVPIDKITTLATAVAGIRSVSNPLPAGGGTDALGVDDSAAFAAERLDHGDRAVCFEDFETLACEASPTIARARCLADRRAAVAGKDGWLRVAILPRPVEPTFEGDAAERASESYRKPAPTLALRESVRDWLTRRADGALGRPGAGRIAVVAPRFVEVRVRATLEVAAVHDVARVGAAAQAALLRFLHPVSGGRRGDGWDFGVGLHASDVHAALRGIPGLRAVRELSFAWDEAGTETTGDTVPVAADALVASAVLHDLRADVGEGGSR